MNIWFVERKNGGWGEPLNPGEPFNPMKSMYISMSLKGNIYTSDISAGPGNEAVAIARVVEGEYHTLERLGSPINIQSKDMYPFIAPDESYLIFSSARTSEESSSGMFVSFRNEAGIWEEPKAIDLGIQAGLPFISPDAKYLFFTAGEKGKSDIYWVDARIVFDLKDRLP